MKTAWKVVLSIIVAVLLLFIVAEAGIRAFVAHQVTSQAPEGCSTAMLFSPLNSRRSVTLSSVPVSRSTTSALPRSKRDVGPA